jgi:hypothetical protein
MKMQDKIFFKLEIAGDINLLIAETAAKKNNSERKVFSSVDLWNIRRRRRSITIR